MTRMGITNVHEDQMGEAIGSQFSHLGTNKLWDNDRTVPDDHPANVSEVIEFIGRKAQSITLSNYFARREAPSNNKAF